MIFDLEKDIARRVSLGVPRHHAEVAAKAQMEHQRRIHGGGPPPARHETPEPARNVTVADIKEAFEAYGNKIQELEDRIAVLEAAKAPPIAGDEPPPEDPPPAASSKKKK